jgi:hypothetical protein
MKEVTKEQPEDDATGDHHCHVVGETLARVVKERHVLGVEPEEIEKGENEKDK